MTDALRRAARTFLDAAILQFTTLMTLPQFVDTVGGQPIPKWSMGWAIVVSCGTSGVLAVANWAKNYLEDSTGKNFIVAKTVPEEAKPRRKTKKTKKKK